MIDELRLKELLSGICRVDVRDLIDSTKAEAKRIAQDIYDKGDLSPVLIIAREQTAGRGRMGRSFLSRADKGIFMSLLYFTEKELADAISVTTAAAAFVACEIEAACGRPMRIKWVNDVYNDRGKVCGILAETLRIGSVNAVIVGIGINIGADDFPEELRGIASSIGNIGEKEELLISGITRRLIVHGKSPEKREYMDAYRKRFMLQGEDVELLQGGEVIGSGRVLGVDDDGGLLLIPDGESREIVIRSGEVSVRKNKTENSL